MRKGRLAGLGCVVVASVVFACGEFLEVAPPSPDGDGGDDARAADGTSGDESTTGDGASNADAPTCDANLPSDKNNCGACGRQCELPECIDGQCKPAEIITNMTALANGHDPSQILIHAGQIFVVDGDNGGSARAGVLRCPEPAAGATCTASRVFHRALIQQIAIADASVAYAAMANAGIGDGYDGGVGTVPIDAGGDATAKDQAQIDARSIAVLGSTVLIATPGGLFRCGVPCTAPTLITNTSAVFHVVADASGYCFSGSLGPKKGVHCASAIGTTPVTIGETNEIPRLALAGADVVWADKDAIGSGKRVGGGTPALLPLPGQVTASSPIIADGNHVSWIKDTKQLLRCSRAECTTPTVIVEVGPAGPQLPPRELVALGQSEKWIYFAEGSVGAGVNPRVLRVPK